MISRALMVLVIISSFPIVSTLQLPPKVMAQASSEAAKVLVDDTIEALKSNDTSKAQIHLSILNRQLPSFVNSTSLQSVKVLLDDVSSALKNNDVNNALIHLNLVKQQLTPSGGSTTVPSPTVKQSTTPAASSHVTNVQANHPPKANDISINTTSGTPVSFRLKGDDPDGDPITFSVNQPVQGKVNGLGMATGDITYDPTDTCVVCTDSFNFTVTDSHDAVSNNGTVTVFVSSPQEEQSSKNGLSSRSSVSSAPSEELSFPQPSTDNTETKTSGVTNENSPSSETDYSSICAKIQPVLIQSCGTLVNSDGSLTSEGTHAMHCIRNGILLGGGAAALTHLPLSIILKGLSMLAAPTGCDGIVNMKAFDQLGDIGSLSSLTNLLP